MSRLILAAIIITTFFAACQQGESKTPVATDAAKAANAPVDPASLTTIQWLDSTLDKGTITEGEKIEVAYRFKNTGNKPLVIKDVRPSCGCTVAEKPEEPIAPGGEGIIKGVFNSANKLGPNHKTIHVVTNTQPDTYALVFNVVVNKKN
ncbi:DUF1573 domain-containing protein [Terrimonas sp.]|uniref:DUF1573 domain-containing protein n=1 Tax=Terrimonas sp. TaxID=1914338 RepID=UPI000D51D14F|nr:DUF1573 domain-containing protein [Terrimonas sp.]PVD51315.1 DUF1573 domain-containing protein [Terrimonas sp.]